MVVNGIEKRYNQRKLMNGEMIMALINCPECGTEINDKATICPHCSLDIMKYNQRLIAEKRFEKLDILSDDYSGRDYRQEDLAKKYNMFIRDVRKALQIANYEHTKLKSMSNPNNLNPGQKVSLFQDARKLGFLDKYDIKRE